MSRVDEYVALLDAVEGRWSPTPTRVARAGLLGPRQGLLRAADEADTAASSLCSISPPEGVEAQHAEFVAALRELAVASRQTAEESGWHTRRHRLSVLRKTGALDRYVNARREVRSAAGALAADRASTVKDAESATGRGLLVWLIYAAAFAAVVMPFIVAVTAVGGVSYLLLAIPWIVIVVIALFAPSAIQNAALPAVRLLRRERARHGRAG